MRTSNQICMRVPFLPSALDGLLQWYAIVMVLVFPMGIPLAYLIVLCHGRKRINPHPENHELSIKMREEDPTIQKSRWAQAAAVGARRAR